MLFDIYVYHDDPIDALSAGARTGELCLKKQGRDNGLEAHLYRQGTKEDLLPSMRYVHLIAMNSTSMVIEGTRWASERPNSRSKVGSYKERWIIKHVGAPAVVDAKRLQRRTAARLKAVLVSGFDPADDDALDPPLPDDDLAN